MSKDAELEAKKVFEALKSGTPPPERIEQFTVGRQKEREHLKHKIEDTISGEPQVIFIRGDYGEGKSHLLQLFQEMALKQGFIVAYVTLNSREQPLHDLGRIYRKVASSLLCLQEKLTLGDLFGKCARQMLDTVQSKLDKRCKHGLTYRSCARLCLGNELLEKHFPALSKQDYSISSAIKILVWAIMRKDKEIETLTKDWINGYRLANRQCKKLTSGKTELPSSVSERDIIAVFFSLSTVCSLAGYKGIVILFDEAESIPSVGRWQDTLIAYLNLLRIIQYTQEKEGNLMFIYATTPTFYEDIDYSFFKTLRNQGFEEIADFVEQNLHSNTIKLEPLSNDSLRQLARLITEVAFQSRGKKMNVEMWYSLAPEAQKVIKAFAQDRTMKIGNFVTQWCGEAEKIAKRID